MFRRKSIRTVDSSQEAQKLASEKYATRFYEELSRVLGRYRPEKFGPTVATILYETEKKRGDWRFYPPHDLIHSIEANCAYHRTIKDEAINQDRLNKAFNLYKGYNDPYIKYSLAQRRVDLFAMALARQQFPIQKEGNVGALARSLLLFSLNEPLKNTEKAFKKSLGLSFHDWIYMCFATLAAVAERRPPIISIKNFLESEVSSIPKDAVEPFVRTASLTTNEIKKKYHERRKEFPAFLHIFIPSIFFDYPLINYENDRYLVVHPNIVFFAGSSGIFRLAKRVDEENFQKEIGQSFETYVNNLLKEVPNSIQTISEKQFQSISNGRTCDYIVELEDSIFLIECKATQYSSILLTENAVANDNSTGKIASAIDQIQQTATRIIQGQASQLLSPKPIYGIIVTYGDFYFANSSWYLESYILPKLEEKDSATEWFSPLSKPIQIFSIESFEYLIAIIINEKNSPKAIIDGKLSEDYLVVGDWDTYLSKYKAPKYSVPILKETATNFFKGIVG